MVPALASAAVQAAVDATPLVQRLDFHYPTHADARREDQYLLAGDLLVAPIDPFPPPAPPGPGPAPPHHLAFGMAKCSPGKASQIWIFTKGVVPGDSQPSTLKSPSNLKGCLEITGCSSADGAVGGNPTLSNDMPNRARVENTRARLPPSSAPLTAPPSTLPLSGLHAHAPVLTCCRC